MQYAQHRMMKKVSLLSGDVYEIELRPSRVQQTIPTVLGVHVLSQAKLVMLRFFYDFIDR